VGPGASLGTAVVKMKYPSPYRESSPGCPAHSLLAVLLLFCCRVPNSFSLTLYVVVIGRNVLLSASALLYFNAIGLCMDLIKSLLNSLPQF